MQGIEDTQYGQEKRKRPGSGCSAQAKAVTPAKPATSVKHPATRSSAGCPAQSKPPAAAAPVAKKTGTGSAARAAAPLASPKSGLAAPRRLQRLRVQARSHTDLLRPPRLPKLIFSDSFVSASVKATIDGAERASAGCRLRGRRRAAGRTFDRRAAKTVPDAVDPMMAKVAEWRGRREFFGDDRLPPLKEIYVAASDSSAFRISDRASRCSDVGPCIQGDLPGNRKGDEKPQRTAAEVARKALKEIRMFRQAHALCPGRSRSGSILFIRNRRDVLRARLNSDDDTGADHSRRRGQRPSAQPSQAGLRISGRRRRHRSAPSRSSVQATSDR